MENRIHSLEERRGDEPQPIGVILEEWLARYESRFPAATIDVVESSAVLDGGASLAWSADMAVL
jgi:hypothetical protein